MSEKNGSVIALCGNPNVGKSTVFNALTGLRQHTGNWAGKTVELARGSYRHGGREYTVFDLPGAYSLIPHSEEERIARDFICHGGADVLVVICDATCLEHNLNLVFQTLELADRVIVCVNLMDEAKKKRMHIDLKELERSLDVPVIGMSARSGRGIADLKEAVECLLEKNDGESRVGQRNDFGCDDESRLVAIYDEAKGICDKVVKREDDSAEMRQLKIDRVMTDKLTGIPIMAALLALVLWITIAGANYPSQMLSKLLFFIEDELTRLCMAIGMPGWLHGIAVLGAYRVLAWVVAVMLPPMAIFFPLFTLLEDVGYLPRVAFNLDHSLKKCSACGKQALTMCMGFGCNAAGVIGCRIIDSPRERLIAIITNNFVPCNGRFPTLIAIITMFFIGSGIVVLDSALSALALACFVLLGVLMTLFASKLLSKTVLKGMPSSFTLELPPYRRPQVGKVIVRSIFDRTLFVLGRAAAVAAPAGAVIWLMANVQVAGAPLLVHCTGFLDPFAKLMGLDGVILMAFILGLPANEIVIPLIIMGYTATGSIAELAGLAELKHLLVQNGWTWITALCTMLFALMHWPCSTTLLTIKKETGSLKWMVISALVPTVMGILSCMVVASLGKLLT